MFNVLFLYRWKPFDGTKNHKHPKYKRIKHLNKSFENQKELENHLKTCRTLKNKKNLEKTKKTNKTNKTQKTNKTNKTQKNNSQGVLVKHPNFLKNLEFMHFLFFLVFSRFFCVFLNFSIFFCVAAASSLSLPPPSFFK